MKQRILVLGANGYVGQRVMKALGASGWADPVAGVRRPGRHAQEIVLDAAETGPVASALAAVDGVVNCVAGAPQTMVASARALAAALDARPLPLVHFSSMAVYGPAVGDVDETTPPAQGLTGYAGAKVETETLLAARRNVTTLRPGCIYGPLSPQWSLRIASLLRARRIGDLGAAGDGCSNLVYIDDVVSAVLASLQSSDQARVYNLAMAQAPDWNDYFLAYAKALGAVPIRRIGERRLKLETHVLAPALKIGELTLGRAGLNLPPPIPPSLARLWRQPIRLVSHRAEQQLGMRWTSLQQGLAATVAAARP
ncbi:NAD-dependent epimerase/dehydratase family protein [Bordetella genomosp. 12]|uniref:Capsular biosynthesis protein n=1 Tax=Bordetella genomosp. 12 TaxID=463035 RepID=A0A261VA51_9BORD|nr:NAD-dependent epimerase/dehydratase family protein [Bordetella genomosp. 12]OZI70855.1 capsular biosynthesis protein [Bordetella genomosp. 12]